MPKIDTITYLCHSPEAQQHFYTDILGMDYRSDGTLGYGNEEAGVKFERAEQPYQGTKQDLYWKIALAVPNIELAYQQLTAKGVKVSEPEQFKDIGYLTHFQDGEGFTIELIEHWFKGNRPQGQLDTSRLGGGASLNLLTLRSHDITLIKECCLAWGMAPLAIQPVLDRGFTLHFFAFTEDKPPSDDLYSVLNREWLYQRSYTVLEIQEVHGALPMVFNRANTAGYKNTTITGSSGLLDSVELLVSNKN